MSVRLAFTFATAVTASLIFANAASAAMDPACEPGKLATKYPSLVGKTVKFGADPQTPQGESYRIGTVAAADDRGNPQPGSELGFEGAQFVAENVPAGRQRTRNSVINLLLQGAIAGAGVGLRDHR